MHVVGFGDQSATLVTHAERPDLEDQAQGEDFLSQWPTFMFHDPVANEHHSVPLAWDGSEEDLPDGWDEALVRGSIGHKTPHFATHSVRGSTGGGSAWWTAALCGTTARPGLGLETKVGGCLQPCQLSRYGIFRFMSDNEQDN